MNFSKIARRMKTISKTQILNYGLALFFFSLPWQTRFIFGQVNIGGSPYEYGIQSLYVTQMLVLFIALLVLDLKWKKVYAKLVVLGLALVWLATIFSLFFSINKTLASTSLVQLIFSFVLFLLLLDKRVQLKFLLKAFIFGLVLPVMLGVFQFFNGASFASTYLGLASRSSERLGDAVLLIGNTRVLRAYGSFSHPNIFGGYLAVGLVAIFSTLQSVKKNSEQIVFSLIGVLLSLGLILTFSRSAFAGLAVGVVLGTVIFLVKRPSYAKRLVGPAVGFMVVLALLITLFSSAILSRFSGVSPVESHAISERLDQYRDFPEVIGSSWLLGYGLGNYTLAIHEAFPNRQWFEYQPVHNVPLLVVGEIGILGLFILIALVITATLINFKRFSHIDAVFAFMTASLILTITFFDHYIWTSWSGQTLAVFVLALLARSGERK
ncbi:hypothetical protein COY25_00275 [Candidatus Uhrbacteria bacterium CG_4_10_14_0_2_um_filter_41_7]|uniref:O-antigen ligase-related domain-containing protein n=1 Tax=Candidatus Uhrbacteria bacterium CG_4_9_14_3_um_filter_41_35 TaxID=1975034 RepID=A0A2M7XGB8_9BACT|nr:MAG: hypothetical protein COY25_00275 [Candidatus Uhrbacteria bacterium CG_4_10_14_0_2_um_filter_41_7]PJA46895.1 MAG: hypothetical protein CO173_00695 [Candidatus Uhrbacteria bacterium CG_4_9_14_3_um_filter_41_35]